eukprot:14909927-Alexandrium_andersonii.AAC.1
MSTALQLGAVQLHRELQVRAGLAHPLSHCLRVHARVADVHIEAAPVRARRAPYKEIGPARAQQADDAIAIIGPVEIPGPLTGAGADVKCPGRQDAQARIALRHRRGPRR